MKYIFAVLFTFCLAWTLPAMAQSSPKLAFNQAANLFIEGQNEQALRNVNNALRRYPNDPQLKALKEKLEQQQEQQQQQQEQQQQEQQNGEKDQNQEQSEEQDGENQPQDSQQQEGEEGEPDDQQKQEQQQEGEGEESQDQKEQQPEEGEEGSEEQEGGEMDTERRLQEMNISPEKARMILEAMKSNEVQYLQQKKRKQSSRSNSNKPDW